MNKLLAAIVVSLSLLVPTACAHVQAQPATTEAARELVPATLYCGKRTEVERTLVRKLGLVPIWLGLDGKGKGAWSLWVTPDETYWIFALRPANKPDQMCLLAGGREWLNPNNRSASERE